jgi:hypothetical protein
VRRRQPWTLIAGVTAVQTGTPSAMLGRVAATSGTVMFGPNALAIPLGSAAVQLGSRPPFLFAAAVCLSAAILARPRSRGRGRLSRRVEVGMYFRLVAGVLVDLRDKNDRMMLGFQAVQAEWMADSIRDNVLRGIVGAAEAGRPHGKVTYLRTTAGVATAMDSRPDHGPADEVQARRWFERVVDGPAAVARRPDRV